MISIGALSDKGEVRETNQDACCVELAQTSIGDVVMAVVCDGVGGLDAGEYASAVVVANFVRWFKHVLPCLIDQAQGNGTVLGASTIRESWGNLITQLNEALLNQRDKTRMGTTFSGVIALDGRYVVAHIGDTRIYRLSKNGTISQITEDQTLVNSQLAEGDITLDEAVTSHVTHVIMQAIGSSDDVIPVFYSGRYRNGDLFVACSDGAWHRAGEEGIQTIFEEADWRSNESLNDACDQLIKHDLSLGETDNLTVACFAINDASQESNLTGGYRPTEKLASEYNRTQDDSTYIDITRVDVGSSEEGDA